MLEKKEIIGKIHSFESFGTLDWPGIRFVVFMSWCPLKCKYCHNIDIAIGESGKSYSSQEVLDKVVKVKEYISKNWGVTVSWGDPFMQPEFLEDFLKKCNENNIHTCVDTSLFTNKENIDKVAKYTDLFMVSIKHMNDDEHKKLTWVSNNKILENIQYISKLKKDLIIRFVLVPGYTDTEENLIKFKEFLKNINYKKIEILPYSNIGEFKWKELWLNYKFKKQHLPTADDIIRVKKFLNIH